MKVKFGCCWSNAATQQILCPGYPAQASLTPASTGNSERSAVRASAQVVQAWHGLWIGTWLASLLWSPRCAIFTATIAQASLSKLGWIQLTWVQLLLHRHMLGRGREREGMEDSMMVLLIIVVVPRGPSQGMGLLWFVLYRVSAIPALQSLWLVKSDQGRII